LRSWRSLGRPKLLQGWKFNHPGYAGLSSQSTVDVTQTGNNADVGPPHSDDRAWADTLLDAFGTTSRSFLQGEIQLLASGLRNNGEARISPDVVNAADQFPQTASGKIQKFLLREQFSPG
jgi:hypothetical protein